MILNNNPPPLVLFRERRLWEDVLGDLGAERLLQVWRERGGEVPGVPGVHLPALADLGLRVLGEDPH